MVLDNDKVEIPFDEVFRQEKEQIARWRSARPDGHKRGDAPDDKELVGIALSGGGVRSATFGLGVLQGLARFELLNRFDYLSSAGGGSYITGWLLTWIRSRGYQHVKSQLSSTVDPPEIQGVRESTAFPIRRGASSGSKALLTWLRNVALNLLALIAMLGASILLVKMGIHGIFAILLYAYDEVELSLRLAIVVHGLAITAAILLRNLSRRAEQSATPQPARARIFWAAIIFFLVAAVLQGVGVISRTPSSGVISGSVITLFCAISWFPTLGSPRAWLRHAASATAAGAVAGLLIYLITPGGRFVYDFYVELEILMRVPMVVIAGVISIFLYRLLMGRWISSAVREVSWRFCRSLLHLALLWLWVSLIWALQLQPSMVLMGLAIVTVLIVGGLLKGAGVRNVSRPAKFLLDLLERLAPYVFMIAIAALAAIIVDTLHYIIHISYLNEHELIEIAIASGLLLLSFLLLWSKRANNFTMHSFHRARLARNFLAPAADTTRERAGEDDMNFGELAEPGVYDGPYPLMGAALDVAEVVSSGSAQQHTVPFLFSPLFSGFELPEKTTSVGAYRPTKQLGGGISLATAMAVSQPLRAQPLRPASATIAMLWTVFDMRDGRFMGNPLRDDTWNKPGPLVEAAYALREGFGDPTSEAAYVRPSSGREFDNLGIYELVKRQCRFIIACDATSDPSFSFDDLGATIRRCRTELGVEIEMDLGPLGRTPATSGAHCQIALIRYPNNEAGLIVYIKPSLTGDEPADLVQYAKVHPEFPATDRSDGSFGESDFESYRRLGQHIVETLLSGLNINAEMSTSQVFRLIRGHLQPDFKEPETVTSSPAAEPTVVPPQELVDAIASGECVLCAGPGLAAQAKLPTWPAFLDGLLRAARDSGILDTANATGLAATLSAGELDAVADELTHQVPREFLLDYVRSATSASEPSEAHRLLAQMKFLGALNTNMDDLLGIAFGSGAFVPSQAEKLVAALQAKEPFVTNVFGVASQPSSLLFTLKEFRLMLSANLQFKQFLSTLFLRYTMFFVGSGIDGIRDYLEALELPQSERRHYAIVANSGQLDPVKLRILERSYNVHVIDFQPRFNFAGLPAFLERLRSEVDEKAPRAKASGALVLKSVTLENIGPFDSLYLDFTPSWNLLLGDNGVGKTVLLKAIAAALCGEKAEPAAVARLLRSGAASGSIRLKVDNSEYTVKLMRDDDGSVQISPPSLSPIKSDNWLVLGFPALRSIPLDRPKGPNAPKPEAPSPDDLLPILRGEPDDRIADLKQWLVNLDYAAGKEPSPSPSSKLLADFFAVLQELTPDLRLKFHSIDQKTMEIKVETDGGIVPLEAISQGTGSVMCWIGTLLERLSETAGTRGPKQNSALVLIDELDAHMHPRWQQMFVTAFSSCSPFKTVQIIATTHSPMLVGSLKSDQIWLIHRAPLKSEIYGVVHSVEVNDGKREIVILGPEDDEEEGEVPAKRKERRYLVPAKTELRVKEGEIVEEQEPLTKGDIRAVAERVEIKMEGWRADQILTSPLFELETTRDPKTAKLLNDYSRLIALENPTQQEKDRLAEVAQALKIRLGTEEETEAAREAFALIRDFANERLKKLPPEKQQEVLNEVKKQLAESIKGTGGAV